MNRKHLKKQGKSIGRKLLLNICLTIIVVSLFIIFIFLPDDKVIVKEEIEKNLLKKKYKQQNC